MPEVNADKTVYEHVIKPKVTGVMTEANKYFENVSEFKHLMTITIMRFTKQD
jgi:hypothetical protein